MYFHERFICKEFLIFSYFFVVRNSISRSYKWTAYITVCIW